MKSGNEEMQDSKDEATIAALLRTAGPRPMPAAEAMRPEPPANFTPTLFERLGIGHTAAQSLLARARVAFRDGLEAVFGASAADVLASLEA